jgi:hypothetical protein
LAHPLDSEGIRPPAVSSLDTAVVFFEKSDDRFSFIATEQVALFSGHKCCSRKVEKMMQDMKKMVGKMVGKSNATSIMREMIGFITVKAHFFI